MHQIQRKNTTLAKQEQINKKPKRQPQITLFRKIPVKQMGKKNALHTH